MSKIYVGDTDDRERSNILSCRAYDVQSGVGIIPTDFEQMLGTNRDRRSLTRYSFETKKFGAIENILDEYIVMLTDPKFINNVTMSNAQARVLEYNESATALLLYGDVNMGWCIPFLNDLIKHPSDITAELLTKDGIKAFNNDGVNMLRQLIKFKNIKEENEGTDVDTEALFSLDSF